jgi:hypothetical protein
MIVSKGCLLLASALLLSDDVSRHHHSADAFVVTTKISPVLAPSHVQNRILTQQLSATASSNSDEDESTSSTMKKRRRKRKVQEETNDLEEMLIPRDEDPVELQVKDVRDFVDGGSPKAAEVPKEPVTAPSMSAQSSTPASSAPSQSSNAAGNLDDSLAMLLEDAKRMQSESGNDSSAVSAIGEEESLTVKQTAANIISTIVTADFFVVCGFLLWFLLGIFCSTVLKDDTVQIAFNSNFQAFVQPALGILMIGAIAGNFFKEEEEE